MVHVGSQEPTMGRLLICLAVLTVFFVSIQAEYAATASSSESQNPYGVVYAVDFDNNQQKRDNGVEYDEGRDFNKLPENGLLIIRLLPRSMLKGTVLEDVGNENVHNGRFKRSPGNGGCAKCGGGGGGGGGRPGGGGGGGGGGGSAGAWSSSSSGAWGKGGGKGKR